MGAIVIGSYTFALLFMIISAFSQKGLIECRASGASKRDKEQDHKLMPPRVVLLRITLRGMMDGVLLHSSGKRQKSAYHHRTA